MPIRLQVFEDRYLGMIQACMDQKLPFGVVLIKEGMEALGPLPIPHEVGCLTSIQRLQSLDDGRLNLVGQGIERIEIHEVHREGTYLRAAIRECPLSGSEDPSARQLAKRVQPLLARYLVETAALRERRIDPPELPSHPLRLAYLTCSLLQIPSDAKQLLLDEENASRLLSGLLQTLKQEIPLLRMMRQRSLPGMMGSFGLN
jgi:Lon protease-like protein